MKDIIIICDNSFGLDVKEIVLAINEYWEKNNWGIPYRIKGFIGTREISPELKQCLTPYLGSMDNWIPTDGEVFAMGIIDPCKKQQAVIEMKTKGAKFETLWAPWVMAHLDFVFPEGCIIAAQSIMDSARIGQFVTLFHSMVGFDAIVEDYSSVMAYANITTAHIGKRVYIGNNSVVIEKKINDDAVVCHNSVVVKEVKSGTIVSGNPARKVNNKGGKL